MTKSQKSCSLKGRWPIPRQFVRDWIEWQRSKTNQRYDELDVFEDWRERIELCRYLETLAKLRTRLEHLHSNKVQFSWGCSMDARYNFRGRLEMQWLYQFEKSDYVSDDDLMDFP